MKPKDDGKVYMMEESRTLQAPAAEIDVNVLVARAKAGEDLSRFVRPGQYLDMTQVPTDLRDALAIVQRANDLFMSLDANVRERFFNDPARMVDFLSDSNNRDEAIKLGLVKAPEEPIVDEHLDALKSIDKSLKASSDSKSRKRSDRDEE